MDPAIIFGIFICVGIIITYLPQFHKIVSNKTSEGISHYFLLIGLSGACASLSNAFIFYSDIMFECNDFVDCSVKLLSFYQIGIQFMCFCVFYTLALTYIEIDCFTPFHKRKEFKIMLLALVIVLMITILSIVSVFEADCSEENGQLCIIWAKSLGYFSLGTVFLQYIPQIHEIYLKKNIGSISLITLILQVVGNAVWTAYMWLDTESHITIWLPYLGTTCFQFILVVLCIVFEIKRRRTQKIYANDDNNDLDSTEPLLVNVDQKVRITYDRID